MIIKKITHGTYHYKYNNDIIIGLNISIGLHNSDIDFFYIVNNKIVPKPENVYAPLLISFLVRAMYMQAYSHDYDVGCEYVVNNDVKFLRYVKNKYKKVKG